MTVKITTDIVKKDIRTMRIGEPNLINSLLFPELMVRSTTLGFSGALFGPWSAGPTLGP